jgi:cation:H+ antiporter
VSRSLLPRLILAFAVPLPALFVRILGVQLPPTYTALIYGAAVVGAAVILAWAAETAQLDISGSLAIAILALIAVLPEYAVDAYFAYAAGSKPEYAHYAAANMTGSNRLLLGLGWPLVALVAGLGLRKMRKALRKDGVDPEAEITVRRTGRRGLDLHPKRRIELLFLGIAALYSFTIPFTGRIALYDCGVLLGLYCLYLWRVAKEGREEPDLEGVCALIGCLPRRQRRITVVGMFLAAAAFIMISAEPFANSLVETGRILGIDEFLLVQWLAPLVSESPELIVACLLAYRLKSDDAIGALLSSKVNQWTLLVGTIPLAFLAGGGNGTLILDARQTEEFILTAAQTVMGFAVLTNLRFEWREAMALAALFFLQFPFPQTTVRLGFSAAYVVLALIILIKQRSSLPPIWMYVFSKKARMGAGAGAETPPAGAAD